MVSLEVVAILLSGISISASLFYYANVLQNANTTRQTQLFMNMYKEFVTESEKGTIYVLMNLEYKDYEDFEHKYGHEHNPEINNLITHHMMLMEGLGVLVREGYIGIRLVALLTSGTIIMGWEKLREYIYEVRKRNNMPRWSIEWEYLYNELMKYAEQHPELEIK